MSKQQPYGNIKMRGKLEKVLPCGCCVAVNRKKTDLEEWAESNLKWELIEYLSIRGGVNIHPDYQDPTLMEKIKGNING